MKTCRSIILFLLVLFLFGALGAMGQFKGEIPLAIAGEQDPCIPDKELCARMIRAGQEFCERGKYKEAKEHFRRAVQADPYSAKAWHFYNTCFIFSWAAELKKKPVPPLGATTSDPTKGTTKTTPAPPPATESEKEEEEGC